MAMTACSCASTRAGELAWRDRAVGQHPLQVQADAVTIGICEGVAVFLLTAVGQSLADVQHQRVAIEVAVGLIEHVPVHAREAQAKLALIGVTGGKPVFATLVVQADVVVTLKGNVSPATHARDIGITVKLAAALQPVRIAIAAVQPEFACRNLDTAAVRGFAGETPGRAGNAQRTCRVDAPAGAVAQGEFGTDAVGSSAAVLSTSCVS